MLGPVLFVVYINDLPESIKSLVYIFADDSKFCRVIDQPKDRKILQNDLVEAENWQDLWLLGFHPKKCKAMTVSNDGFEREDAKYTLRGHHLDTVSSEKDLVIIDSRLSFSEHIQTAVNKAHRVMGAIRRTYRHLKKINRALGHLCAHIC